MMVGMYNIKGEQDKYFLTKSVEYMLLNLITQKGLEYNLVIA